MLAPNLVYATLPGYYPRLLGDDGVHEPLIIPAVGATIAFTFYSELGQLVNRQIASAQYRRPDSTTQGLVLDASNRVGIPAGLISGGWLEMTLEPDSSIGNYIVYPIRVYVVQSV